jgi:N6-adenosine-specific RNA methylase IME4
MNPGEANEFKNRKDKLRERRELKMLERFQYEPREKSLRERTRNVTSNLNNSFTDSLKPQKISDSEDSSNVNGKKRGRKPKGKIDSSVSMLDSLNKSNKKAAVEGKSLARPVKVVKMDFEDVEMTSLVEERHGEVPFEDFRDNYLDNNEDIESSVSLNESRGDSIFRNPSVNNVIKLTHKNIISLPLNCEDKLNTCDQVIPLNNGHSSILNCKSLSNCESNINSVNNSNNDNILPPDYVNESVLIRERVERDYPREVQRFRMHKRETQNSVASNSEENQNNYAASLKSDTFINCDLRFFNFDLITSRVGHFDVVMIDPPWRIKGGQRNDSSFMFSNSKFNLEYNTLSNNEIVSLPVEKLSKKGKNRIYITILGFCFLWILNSLMNVGYECLNKWGYDVVDQITWVKIRNEKLYISQGYYFLHSSETCLVGYKCPPNERVEYKSKVNKYKLNSL